MSVEVTMEVPFVDQKKYEVEFGKEKGSFVASVGAPAAINIKTQQVVQNKPTEVEYSIVDAKGMDVTATLDKARITVDVKANTGHYDVTSKKLTLWKVGDTAEATVTYHSWVYDQKTGKEDVIEGKATITCVDKSSVTVTGLDKWTIADRVLSWDTDDMKSTIAEGKKGKIWVRMKKSDGTYVDNKENAADFAFEPINTATLYAYSNGEIFATRAGVEYVKVTYFDGTVKYQYTLPVTVGKKAEATSLVLGSPYITISKAASAGTIVTFKVLDQYAEAMDSVGMPKYEKISGIDVATFTNAGKNASKDIQKISVNANGAIGTGVYKLTYDNLSISITVQAQDVSTATSGYMLQADITEIDTTIYEDTKTEDIAELVKGVKLNFVQTKAGLIDKNADKDFKTAVIKINGREINPDNYPMIDRMTDGSLVFKTVLQDGDNYVLLSNKSAGYTIEAEAKIGDKTVRVNTFINVKNNTQLPKKDASYEINKIDATDNMTYDSIISQAVADKTDKTANTLSKTMIINTGRVLAVRGGGKATAIPSDDGAVVADVLSASQVYIDTAALPSFRPADKSKAVWIVMDRLNQEVENKDAGIKITGFANTTTTATPGSAKYGEQDVFQGNISGVSLKDKSGTLTLEKIYWKTDANKENRRDKFDGSVTKIYGSIAGNNAQLKIKQKNDTPAGEYVAVVKYTLADGKVYTYQVEFEITKVVIGGVDIKINGTAPAIGEKALKISGSHIEKDQISPVTADVTFSVKHYIVKDGQKEYVEPTYEWKAGDTPLYEITLKPSNNCKFNEAMTPNIDDSGVITAANYTVKSPRLDKFGNLVIDVEKNSPLS